MTDDSQDIAQALVAALADEGLPVDEGGFTLDKDAALAKLRGYQLADPHAYLLLLVEAAWIAGHGSEREQRITIECRSDTIVRFPGPSLDAARLEDLFSNVFASGRGLDGEPRRRARVLELLGLAANNALALKPEAIFITASDARGEGLRLSVSPEAELTLERIGAIEPGWIEFRFDGHGAGYERGFAERELVSARCRYASFPVFVDGMKVSQRERDLGGLYSRADVMLGDDWIGAAGYRRTPEPPRVEVVNRGVSVELPDPEAKTGFVAIVEADLPMDLSRKQLLEGPELDAIREAIARASATLQPVNYADRPKRSNADQAAIYGLGFIGFFVFLAVLMGVLANRDSSEPITAQRLPPCPTGDVEACERWVASARKRATQTGDHAELGPILAHACLAEARPWCLDAAWYYDYGFVPPDRRSSPPTDADALLERGCGAGIARACELRERPPLAERCAAGEALACYVVGFATLGELANGVDELDRGCELGLAESCYATGVARMLGPDKARDPIVAKIMSSYAERSPEFEAAAANFGAACELGYAPACPFRDWLQAHPDRRPSRGPEFVPLPTSPTPPAGAAPWTP